METKERAGNSSENGKRKVELPRFENLQRPLQTAETLWSGLPEDLFHKIIHASPEGASEKYLQEEDINKRKRQGRPEFEFKLTTERWAENFGTFRDDFKKRKLSQAAFLKIRFIKWLKRELKEIFKNIYQGKKSTMEKKRESRKFELKRTRERRPPSFCKSSETTSESRYPLKWTSWRFVL